MAYICYRWSKFWYAQNCKNGAQDANKAIISSHPLTYTHTVERQLNRTESKTFVDVYCSGWVRECGQSPSYQIYYCTMYLLYLCDSLQFQSQQSACASPHPAECPHPGELSGPCEQSMGQSHQDQVTVMWTRDIHTRACSRLTRMSLQTMYVHYLHIEANLFAIP